MKARILGFAIKACLYGAMWLLVLFPGQILLASIYRVAYVYPPGDHLRELSSTFWGVIFAPPVFRFLGKWAARILEALLGDIWIELQNEWSLRTFHLTNGPVEKTWAGRLRGWFSLLMAAWAIWYYFSTFMNYNRAQFGIMIVWAGIVTSWMKYVTQDPDSTPTEEQ